MTEKNYPSYLDNPKPTRKQTNYERIKAMSIEEMAKFICGIQDSPCHCCGYSAAYNKYRTEDCKGGYSEENCLQGVIKMLESEVSDE